MQPSSQWKGSLFRYSVDASDAGTFEIAGLASNISGIVSVADVVFECVQTGVFGVSGDVIMLADATGSIIASGKAFVAGDIAVEVGAGRRALRSEARLGSVDSVVGLPGAGPHKRKARSGRVARDSHKPRCSQAQPCQMCPKKGRQPGDVNGDCVFDIRDVAYLEAYLINSFGIQDEIVKAGTAARFDMDGNGVVDVLDLDHLIGFTIGILPLVQDVETLPASERSFCLLTLTAKVFINTPSGPELADDADDVAVYFDVESTDPALASQIVGTVLASTSCAVFFCYSSCVTGRCTLFIAQTFPGWCEAFAFAFAGRVLIFFFTFYVLCACHVCRPPERKLHTRNQKGIMVPFSRPSGTHLPVATS